MMQSRNDNPEAQLLVRRNPHTFFNTRQNENDINTSIASVAIIGLLTWAAGTIGHYVACKNKIQDHGINDKELYSSLEFAGMGFTLISIGMFIAKKLIDCYKARQEPDDEERLAFRNI